jgi:hypothetical protein
MSYARCSRKKERAFPQALYRACWALDFALPRAGAQQKIIHKLSTKPRAAGIPHSVFTDDAGGIKIIHIWPEKCKRKIALLNFFFETGRMIGTHYL